MKWISDVVFAILAAHAWGSLMLAIWLHAVHRLEGKGYTRLLFYLLRAVIVAFLLPLGLGVVLIINEILVLDGRFIQTTPVLTMIGLLLFMIWLLGLLANFESVQEQWERTTHWFSDALPASKEKQEHFQEICRQTKMRPGRVLLCEKEGIRCGGITVGLLHPKIVLPKGKSDEFVEHVTMVHELVHYTRKDLWFLTAAKIVEVIHWFNPWTRGLAAEMSQWNEYACDWKVCSKYISSMRAYSEVLAYVSEQVQAEEPGLYSSIGTQPMKLTGRMQKMITMKNAMKNATKKSRVFGVLAAVAVSFTSAGSALASTGVMAGGYQALYELTDVEKEIGGIQVLGDVGALLGNTDIPDTSDIPDNSNINPEDYVNTGIIFRDVLPITDSMTDEDGSEIATQASANINWDIPGDGFMRTTKDFWMSNSEAITVSGDITPVGKILRVGIIAPNGIRYCIYAHGRFSYVFDAYGTGTHCVYAINDNSDVVNLTGGYLTY